jgi:hypothetical protein
MTPTIDPNTSAMIQANSPVSIVSIRPDSSMSR